MPLAKYDIYFSGAIMEGRDREEVRRRIGALFKADEAQLARLFCGTPVKIKSDVDMDTAIKYRLSFREAGALVDIKPVTSTAPEAAAIAPVSPAEPTPLATAPAPGLSALPPNTGSLIDCALPVIPMTLPDISGIGLAEAGILLDDTPPPPPADIDIGALSAAPAGIGSLEDCRLHREPAVLPDISGLTASEPGSGTLEDCYQEKAPLPIPDISALRIVAEPEK